MANKKKTMGLIRQILRLKHSGKSIRLIAEPVKVSSNIVRKYLRFVDVRSMNFVVTFVHNDLVLGIKVMVYFRA